MMGPGMMSPGMMPPGMMMRMILTLMDTDNDGAISLSEFQAAHERMFKAVDANKDGRVTIEEMQAWIQGRATPSAESKPAQ
jgi:Ca2+-binding EF-hand superfamily protein